MSNKKTYRNVGFFLDVMFLFLIFEVSNKLKQPTMNLLTSTPNKNWFVLRELDYSTSLSFFTEHQILIVKNKNARGTYFAFSSALESYLFWEETIEHEGVNTIDYPNIEERIEKIHRNLLLGQYGFGKYSN